MRAARVKVVGESNGVRGRVGQRRRLCEASMKGGNFMNPFSRSARLRRRQSVAVLTVAALGFGAFPSVAKADDVVSDGDLLAAASNSDMAFGSICINATTSRSATLWLTRNGDVTSPFVYDSNSTVTIFPIVPAGPVSVTGFLVITTPSNWEASSAGTLSSTAHATISVLPTALGAGSRTVTFLASGSGSSIASVTRSDTMEVTWTGVSCNTAPTVVVTGVTNGGSYSKGSVPAAGCSVTDAEDGPSAFAASLSAVTGPFASDGIGSRTASCSYTDTGGLTATASATFSVVDPTPPVIVPTITGTLGNNGWYTSNVTLAWSVTDPESTATPTGCSAASIASDQAATTYSCSATSAGGSTGPVTVTIKRDATVPGISAAATPSPNGAGWNNTNVNVAYTCTDTGSGIASCGPNQTLTAEGAAVPYSGTATDNAGNTASTSGTVKIDKTVPTVAVTGVTNGASYVLGSVPAAACSTTDGLSGKATDATLSVTGGPVGSVTATCSGGSDIAGNTGGSASATYSVVFAFSGFRQPVDNLPTLNVTKAGSSIPLKFSLGGYQGMAILANGYPSSVNVACGATAEDPIEETSTAGSSSLNYDALIDQYNYVWKTEKGWAGTCRTLTIKLTDGTIHQANFRFTK